MTPTDYSDMTARVLDGEALRIGSLYWPRPEPPLLMERAKILASAIPSGTIAAGVSAGWVWTGMGIPTPLSLLAASSPSPSPLIRHEWKIRSVKTPHTNITSKGLLTLLTPEATAEDLWGCEAVDEVAAAQLFWLGSWPRKGLHERTQRRQELILQWRSDYPWATR